MIAKTFVVLTAAFVVTTSLVSVADAQRRLRQEHQTVQPFTDAERNWFEIPEGRERLPN
jgi:hypothetical protein